MNPITVLLSISVVLLVAVFSFFVGTMKDEVSQRPEEKQKLEQELKMLYAMKAEKKTEVSNEEKAAEREKVQKLEEELAVLKQEREALMATQVQEEFKEEVVEAPVLSESEQKRQQRRMKLVNQAMIMAQVKQFFPQDGFASLSIINFENVQKGVTLALRRNGGIVGQMYVSTVEGSEAIADAIPHTFLGGKIDIQAGDELILNVL